MRQWLNQQQSSVMGRNRAMSMLSSSVDGTRPRSRPVSDMRDLKFRSHSDGESPAAKSRSEMVRSEGDTKPVRRARSRTTVSGGPGQKMLVVEIREQSEKPRAHRPHSQSISADGSSFFDVPSPHTVPPPPTKPAPLPPVVRDTPLLETEGAEEAAIGGRGRSVTCSSSMTHPSKFTSQLEGLRSIIQASITNTEPSSRSFPLEDSPSRARSVTSVEGSNEALLFDLKRKFSELSAELEAANARVATLSTELRIEKNMRRDLEVKVKELTAQLAQK